MDDERYFKDTGILKERNRELGLRVKGLEADLTHLRAHLEVYQATVTALRQEVTEVRERLRALVLAVCPDEIPACADEIHTFIQMATEHRQTVTALRETLETVLKSAFPNEREHPTMWKAWRQAEAVLQGRDSETTT